MIFPCHYHLQTNNKQQYRNYVKLPDDRFTLIRFFAYLQVSGSVPRSGNKQSGNICRCTTGTVQGLKHRSGSVIPNIGHKFFSFHGNFPAAGEKIRDCLFSDPG